jgi:predicted house-cleaning noncanonical NTP pyrophosphatase (MazG superfamily)
MSTTETKPEAPERRITAEMLLEQLKFVPDLTIAPCCENNALEVLKTAIVNANADGRDGIRVHSNTTSDVAEREVARLIKEYADECVGNDVAIDVEHIRHLLAVELASVGTQADADDEARAEKTGTEIARAIAQTLHYADEEFQIKVETLMRKPCADHLEDEVTETLAKLTAPRIVNAFNAFRQRAIEVVKRKRDELLPNGFAAKVLAEILIELEGNAGS